MPGLRYTASLSTRIISRPVKSRKDKTRGRGTAGPLAQQRAAERLPVGHVEADPELNQPTHDIGTIEHHLRDEVLVGRVVAGFDGVFKMLLWTVIGADSGLDAAFCHNGVAVAEPEL